MAGCLIDQGPALNSLWATLFMFSSENLKSNAPGDLACCARFTSLCVLVPSPWVQEAVGRSNGCAVYNLEIVSRIPQCAQKRKNYIYVCICMCINIYIYIYYIYI